MAAQILQPFIYDYIEINPGKFRSVKHYQRNQIEENPPFTNLLNISNNRNFAKSSPVFWLKVREGNKWKKPSLTGLFRTSTPGVYFGDYQKKKHLIIVKFEDSEGRTTVYCFKNFYTADLREVIQNYIN